MIRRLVSLSSVLLIALSPVAPAATKQAAKTTGTAKKSTTAAKREEPVEAFAAGEAGVPKVRAASAIVVDASTGRVLHEVNADQQRPVASTQKLLTALIVSEEGGLDSPVRVETPDTWAEPSMLYIKPGDVYRRGDLLRVLLVKSMNDVARCLARDNAGSIDAFAGKMNAKATQLGMTSSHFVNPNGLPMPGQYSTARDMAKLAVAAYRNRTIRENVRLKEIQWRYASGKTATFKNTNRVLRNYALCNGMKTGYTEASGFCLVSSAAAEGREVIVVVLGDVRDAVWVDSYRLLSWGLSS
jgi:D-alanyl-D-alanine carboxypeptidase (penicillin-binding protein 5/6)